MSGTSKKNTRRIVTRTTERYIFHGIFINNRLISLSGKVLDLICLVVSGFFFFFLENCQLRVYVNQDTSNRTLTPDVELTSP